MEDKGPRIQLCEGRLHLQLQIDSGSEQESRADEETSSRHRDVTAEEFTVRPGPDSEETGVMAGEERIPGGSLLAVQEACSSLGLRCAVVSHPVVRRGRRQTGLWAGS